MNRYVQVYCPLCGKESGTMLIDGVRRKLGGAMHDPCWERLAVDDDSAVTEEKREKDSHESIIASQIRKEE